MKKKIELTSLLNDALQNDPKAQHIILSCFWDNVYGYVFAKIKNENDAEDITIQTFTKAFSKLNLYKKDFDFKTWLISIAHNTMLDFLKKNKIQMTSDESVVLDIAEEEPDPEELLINKQRFHELKSYLNQLKPNYQKVIELYYLEEKSYKEIAELMDISMSNVKILLLRARNLLFNLMSDTQKNGL